MSVWETYGYVQYCKKLITWKSCWVIQISIQYYEVKSKFSIPEHPYNYNELYNDVNATSTVIGLVLLIDQAQQWQLMIEGMTKRENKK